MSVVISTAAQAGNIYIAQTAQGTGAGSSCTNAKAVTWFNTAANWGSGSSQIGPGTTVNLCGTISSSLTVSGSGTSGNPITILFGANAQLSAPLWTSGAIQASNVSYIILDGGSNGLIQATNSGTNLQQTGSGGIVFTNVSNSEIRNLTINNMYVRTSTAGEDGGGVGIYLDGGGNNSIHNNSISEVENGIMQVYRTATSNVMIYNNYVYHTNWGIAVGEGDVNCSANNIQIYSNEIGDQNVWDDPADNYHHDGIFVYAVYGSDQVTNLKVYSNYIHGNMGNNSTALIYTSVSNVINPQYYNNVLVATSGITNAMITVTTGSGGEIVNNTCVDASNSGSGGTNTCIYFGSGSGGQVENNIAYNCRVSLALVQPVSASTYTSNYNLFYNANQAQSGLQMAQIDANSGSFYFSSFAQWQSSTGFDKNSITTNPQLVNPSGANYHLQSTSPAIGAGVNLSSYFSTDKDGNPRPSTGAWDIGAYKYVSPTSLAPSAPQNLRNQ